MIHFVGAGPGAPDLITLRGAALLEQADCVIYAGSLVNPALLERTKKGCEIHNSAAMTLEQVLAVMEAMEAAGKDTVRLHTGDPSLFGAIREQMDALDARGIPYDDTPGVSSFSGAAAALSAEYTLPGVSQTLIISRMAGRTPVPEGENLAALARHGAALVLSLSSGLLERVQEELRRADPPLRARARHVRKVSIHLPSPLRFASRLSAPRAPRAPRARPPRAPPSLRAAPRPPR